MSDEQTRTELITRIRSLLIRRRFQLLAAQPSQKGEKQDKHEQYVLGLIERHPCIKDVYAEHMEQNDELLVYVFFADLMRFFTTTAADAVWYAGKERLDCCRAVLLEFETVIQQPDHPLQNAVLVGFIEVFYNYCLSASEEVKQWVAAGAIAHSVLEVAPAEMRKELTNELPEALQRGERYTALYRKLDGVIARIKLVNNIKGELHGEDLIEHGEMLLGIDSILEQVSAGMLEILVSDLQILIQILQTCPSSPNLCYTWEYFNPGPP